MDWSYSLLTGNERALFRRMSVFSGGWTLEAVEEVASFGDLRKQHVLDLTEQLVDKSLIVFDCRARFARYRMLETVRQYGISKLEEEGETEKTHLRHASFFTSWLNRMIVVCGMLDR